jgi:FMN phosphatase YigB (HAD superfamily)
LSAPRAVPALDPIRLISWDVDGTLYRPLPVRLAIARRLAVACLTGDGPRVVRGIRAFQRARARLEAQRAGRDLGEAPPDPAREAFERELLLPALTSIGPRAGVRALMADLQARGVPQVAFSDYPSEEKIRALGLRPHLAGFYAGETLAAPKPSALALARIAADFSLAAAQILHIGDRADTDGAAAAAFGCPSLILGRDFADFSALARLLAAVPSAPGRAAGT